MNHHSTTQKVKSGKKKKHYENISNVFVVVGLRCFYRPSFLEQSLIQVDSMLISINVVIKTLISNKKRFDSLVEKLKQKFFKKKTLNKL
jgi:hypothetical protein